MFWTAGYENLSLRSIALKLGLRRSSLYNSFGSKQQIFSECLSRYTERSPTRCLLTYRKGQIVTTMLVQMFDLICELRAKDKLHRGCLAANAYSELAAKDSALGRQLRHHQQRRKDALVCVLNCAIQQQELHENTDSEVTADILLCFMSGLNQQAKNGSSADQLRQICHAFLRSLGFTVNS